MAGPIFWTLLFIFYPLSKTGKKSWAEQHKNKQQNSSLQPQPTSPVIWEKYSLPHICPCRLPSLIYCREKNYSGTVGSTEDLWSQWEWQTWHCSPAELLAVESAGSWSQSISRCSSICSQNICSVSICKSHQEILISKPHVFCCCCFKELEPATAQSHFSFGFWLLLQYSLNIQILTREGYPKEYF